jgi:hypothetical protein
MKNSGTLKNRIITLLLNQDYYAQLSETQQQQVLLYQLVTNKDTSSDPRYEFIGNESTITTDEENFNALVESLISHEVVRSNNSSLASSDTYTANDFEAIKDLCLNYKQNKALELRAKNDPSTTTPTSTIFSRFWSWIKKRCSWIMNTVLNFLKSSDHKSDSTFSGGDSQTIVSPVVTDPLATPAQVTPKKTSTSDHLDSFTTPDHRSKIQNNYRQPTSSNETTPNIFTDVLTPMPNEENDDLNNSEKNGTTSQKKNVMSEN